MAAKEAVKVVKKQVFTSVLIGNSASSAFKTTFKATTAYAKRYGQRKLYRRTA